MNDYTKTLCYWASQLYESERLESNEIYDKLINTKSRIKEVANAKQLVGYVLYNHYNYTQEMVAYEFGLSNHSTIVYWLDRVQSELKTNKRMQYRYNLLKDVVEGKEVKLIRKRPKLFNKYSLSDADKQYIKDNINNGYCVDYFADILNKTRGTVKDYVRFLLAKSVKFTGEQMPKYRVHSFNKRQQIDY